MSAVVVGRIATVAFVAILLLAVALGAVPSATGPSPGSSSSAPPTPADLPSTSASAAPAHSAADPSRAAAVLSEVARSGRPAPDLHLPDLSVPLPYAGERVMPTYASAPAPMGVADLGLTNISGTTTGSILETSSVEGTIQLTSALSANVDGDGPDMFGIQLNAVDTGVTLFGNSTNEFWTQNFVSYTPSSGELVFGDNVWNFSNPDAYLSPNVFYATGPNGTLYAPVYYYAIGPTFTIDYPFTLTLYENSTVLFDRPAVYFNYTVSNSSMSTSGSFDYVVFNATLGTPTSAYPPGVYQINGEQVDPVGLPNDLELDVVGNDDGDTTSFYEMDATLSIATWNSTSGAYVPVSSAMDAGSETGETSDGVSVSYAAGSTVATMRLGPSFIYGLWGLSPDSGARTVVQTLHPAPVFIFVNPGNSLNASAAQWVPSSPTSTTTLYVPNGGAYWIEYLLADHSPGGLLLTAADNSTTTSSFTSALNLGLGVYTPLIAFGNGELGSLSSGGTGTAAHPYTLYNNQYGSLDPEFAAFNDYQFPVFPGLLLIGTTDYVSVTPPSFEIDYPAWMLPTLNTYGLPATNDLQIQLWDSSHVRLVGGTISGWLSAYLIGFPEAPVMLWNSSDNLVDGATFLDQGDGVVLYGGTGNTVWGNLFLPSATGATAPENVLNSGAFAQAVNESESGDLIYNNYFDVPIPAVTPSYDPLSCQISCNAAVYSDAWNVSMEPASVAQTILGEVLTGSILGTWYQGGNYWSNYGNQSNPYGVLPYNDSGWVVSGGDYVPLVQFSLYTVSFDESGLPAASTWSVTANGITISSNTSTVNVTDPNGSLAYLVQGPPGYAATALDGAVEVNGTALVVDVDFEAAQLVTFLESGLPTNASWTVELTGGTVGGFPLVLSSLAPGSLVVSLGPGDYLFNVSASGYVASPSSGAINLTASSGLTEPISFSGFPPIVFLETGLPVNAEWTVWFDEGGATVGVSSTSASLPIPPSIAAPGAYSFTVSAPSGYLSEPFGGSGLVPAVYTTSVFWNLTFSPETGVFSGTLNPSSATLYVDGTARTVNPNGSFSLALPVGVHSVEVTASGYQSYFDNVTVSGSAPTSIAITLAPSVTGIAGISDVGWALIGFLAFLAAVFLVMTLVFAGRRRQPPPAMTPYSAPSVPGATGEPEGSASGPASPSPAPAPSAPPSTPVESNPPAPATEEPETTAPSPEPSSPSAPSAPAESPEGSEEPSPSADSDPPPNSEPES